MTYRSIINYVTNIISRSGLKSRPMTDADLRPSTPPPSRPRKAHSGNQLYIPIHASAIEKSGNKECLEKLEGMVSEAVCVPSVGKKESLPTTARQQLGGDFVARTGRVPFVGLSRKEINADNLMSKVLGDLAERLLKSNVILMRHKSAEMEVVENKRKRDMGWEEG